MDGDNNQPEQRMLREAAEAVYQVRPGRHLKVVQATAESPADQLSDRSRKVKTSVYLDRGDVDRLAWLAEVEKRPQAEIIRDAIRHYEPAQPERGRIFRFFDLAEGDGRPIADMSDEELFAGMGDDARPEADD